MRRQRFSWVWVLGLVVATVVPLGAASSSASDRPRCAGRSATIVGTPGDDTIVGTKHADVIVGLTGDDRLIGAGGDDVICGGLGNDRLRGAGASDVLAGGGGVDVVRGGEGADRLRGSLGNDRLEGRAGPDVIDGGVGLDLCLSPAPPSATTCENTTLASVGAAGGPADEETWDGPSVSADGRYVVFSSGAKNLVANDANGHTADVFIRDRLTGVTDLVSVAMDGGPANANSDAATVSGDGRYVAFLSSATNLDGNSGGLFLRDLQTQTTSRILSEEQKSTWDVAVSADGRHVSFTSWAQDIVADDTNDVPDVFVLDTQTGTAQRVSVGTGGAQATMGGAQGAMSANNRYVAFVSGDPDLVPGDTNGHTDVFVHDLLTGNTTRVSVASDESQVFADSAHPSISADGQIVAFESAAANLVAGDTNDVTDVFVHDRMTGDTRRVSIDRHGNQVAQPSRLDWYNSLGSRLSADGRYVGFQSSARHLVPGDTNGVVDAFVHDRVTGNTTRLSIATTGEQADGASSSPAISADGSTAAFASVAENLVPQATNEDEDMFVRIIH